MKARKVVAIEKYIILSFFLFGIISLAQGCASPPVGYEKGISDLKRNQIHKTTPRPVISKDDEYVSSTEKAFIKLPADILLDWLVNVPLEKVLPGTDDIARVTHTDLLTDRWGHPKSRRRVVLSDGNTALEELVSYEERALFQYVVWNFTNEAHFVTNYALAEFSVEETNGGSYLVWTYRFQKKGWLTGFFLERFVQNKYKKFMASSMKIIKELSVKDLKGFRDSMGRGVK